MRVGKISTTDFGGKWVVQPKKVHAITMRDGKNGIFHAKAVYRPFADETQEEIDRTFLKARPAYGFSKYEGPWGPNAYEIDEYVMGDRLDVTSAEYNYTHGTDDYEDEIICGPIHIDLFD